MPGGVDSVSYQRVPASKSCSGHEKMNWNV